MSVIFFLKNGTEYFVRITVSYNSGPETWTLKHFIFLESLLNHLNNLEDLFFYNINTFI